MRILFGSAHPYFPQITGGAQASTNEMAGELRALGHEVAVLAGLTGKGWTGLRARALLKLGRGGIVKDDGPGYPVYRGWFPERHAGEAAARFAPDVAVLQSGRPVPLARAFADCGVPVVFYFRNAEADDLGGDPASVPGAAAIANSRFTADHHKRRHGIDSTVILPMITAERYRTRTTRETVTFVNPHPHKGLDTALALAEACRDIPFLFVEAWSLDPETRARLSRAVERLPNVTLRPPTADMRAIYARTAILLAPSRWQEAFGRVAAEAQFSGIPVLASNCGGLPEAVGSGGILIEPDAPIRQWVAALRQMWDDASVYEGLSFAAARRAKRPALDKAAQTRALVATLEAAVERRAGLPEAASRREAPQAVAPGNKAEAPRVFPADRSR